MKRIALTLGLLLSAAVPQAAFAERKVVGYSTSWSGDLADVAFARLTHIHYAFLIPNADGSVGEMPNPGKLTGLVAAAHAQGKKVSISVGGWNNGYDGGFETLASSEGGRTNFVNSLLTVVGSYGLDGVDIDWEYPDPGQSSQNFSALMRQLCAALHAQAKLCSAAVVSGGITASAINPDVFPQVDYLGIMAYDGGDGAEHSPYSLALSALNFWVYRGLPKEKAVLGVPFYGRPGWVSYRDIVARDPQAPFKDVSNGVYYNGLQTIKDKTRLGATEGGGVMIWEIGEDTTDASSLLGAIADQLAALPPPPPATPSR